MSLIEFMEYIISCWLQLKFKNCFISFKNDTTKNWTRGHAAFAGRNRSEKLQIEFRCKIHNLSKTFLKSETEVQKTKLTGRT